MLRTVQQDLTMASNDVESVRLFTSEIGNLLESARNIKATHSIEPALTISDFEGQVEQVGRVDREVSQDQAGKENGGQAHYAAIETAFRNIFYDLLVSLLKLIASYI